MKWTTDELLRCAELLKDGASAKEIAAVLGKTKGAIVGMVHRHADLAAIGFANPPLPLTPHQLVIHRERLKARDGRQIIYGRALGKPLLALGSTHCRFPLWAHDAHPPVERQLFCALAKEPDSSYCAKHAKLCRSKPRGME